MWLNILDVQDTQLQNRAMITKNGYFFLCFLKLIHFLRSPFDFLYHWFFFSFTFLNDFHLIINIWIPTKPQKYKIKLLMIFFFVTIISLIHLYYLCNNIFYSSREISLYYVLKESKLCSIDCFNKLISCG